jgi:hypothetical protein
LSSEGAISRIADQLEADFPSAKHGVNGKGVKPEVGIGVQVEQRLFCRFVVHRLAGIEATLV